jgi:hypothetical protein
MPYLHMRETPNKTVTQLRKEVGRKAASTLTTFDTIKIDTAKDTLAFKALDGKVTHEVPLSGETTTHLCELLEVPGKFIERQDPDFRQVIFDGLVQRRRDGSQVLVRHHEQGARFYSPLAHIYDPHMLVDVAKKVVGTDALVDDVRMDKGFFGFDVIDPRRDFGDKKVGDITRAGLRFGIDLAKNHTPWVQPYQYRLACTNGLSGQDTGLAVDGRGQTIDAVLASLEENARIAFERVEAEIGAFYDLRNVPVENPERTLHRLAEEQGLSAAMTVRIAERIPAEVEGDATMFDIVNLLTNEANNLRVKPRMRSLLQGIGGQVVTEHAARCGHCQARLN